MIFCDRCLHNAALHQGTSGCLTRGCVCVRTNGSSHADSVPASPDMGRES